MWSYLCINYNMSRAFFQSLYLPSAVFFTVFALASDWSGDCSFTSAANWKQEANWSHGSPVKYFLEQIYEYDSNKKSILSPVKTGCGPTFE